MTRRDTYEDDLRDPGLAALLREAYADDPALEASPGRTERIMRLVLAEGHTRPAPRARVWAPLAWAVGAVASAAAGVALIIMLATPHGAADLLASFKPAAPTPYVTPAPVRHTPRAAGHDTAPAPIPSVDVTNDGPAPTWENAPDDGQLPVLLPVG